MTPAAIIAQADADGVTLALTQTGTIKASGEPAIINRWLPIIRQHKPALLAHLRRKPEPQDIIADPDGPCSKCGTAQYWQLPGEPWHCRRCEPLTAADRRIAGTLTLACHSPLTRPVRDSERVDALLAEACKGLPISVEQLRQELEANGDLPDVASGELSAHGLRLVAESLVAVNMLPALEAEANKRMSSGKGIDGSGGRGNKKTLAPLLEQVFTETGRAAVQAAVITGAESIADTKRDEALALLAANPETRYALVSDDTSDSGFVFVHLAIRHKGTCKLRIPRSQYDGLAILEMLGRQNAQ